MEQTQRGVTPAEHVNGVQMQSTTGAAKGPFQGTMGGFIPSKLSCEHCCNCICHQTYKLTQPNTIMCYCATT